MRMARWCPCVWGGGGGARVSSPAPAPPPATCSWSHYWSLHRARHNILIEGSTAAATIIMGATLRSTEHWRIVQAHCPSDECARVLLTATPQYYDHDGLHIICITTQYSVWNCKRCSVQVTFESQSRGVSCVLQVPASSTSPNNPNIRLLLLNCIWRWTDSDNATFVPLQLQPGAVMECPPVNQSHTELSSSATIHIHS